MIKKDKNKGHGRVLLPIPAQHTNELDSILISFGNLVILTSKKIRR